VDDDSIALTRTDQQERSGAAASFREKKAAEKSAKKG